MKRVVAVLLVLFLHPSSSAAQERELLLASTRRGPLVVRDLRTGATLDESRLRERVTERKGERWVLYVHGYGVSADAGSQARARQLAATVNANTLMLEWDAGIAKVGLVPGYVAWKHRTATRQGVAFARLVEALFWDAGEKAPRVTLDVIAHSMGTEVIRAMLTDTAFPPGIKHLALVAPYNYYDRFDKAYSEAIGAKVGKTTVYASTTDWVLGFGKATVFWQSGKKQLVGSLNRPHTDTMGYAFVNVTCLHRQGLRIDTKHFPVHELFTADVIAFLDDMPTAARIPVRFRYGKWAYDLLNLGDLSCNKLPAGRLSLR